jgi:predicted TIM-barrel fold metal-dependent hydrolase
MMHDHENCGCPIHGETRADTNFGRRDVLAGLGLAAAGSALTGAGLIQPALGAAANIAKTGRIDVHNHIVPPFFAPLMKANGMWQKDVEDWNPQYAIENFDKYGTATAMVSIPNPHQFPTGDAMRKLSRDCNEYAAKLCTDYPGRFGNFAILPLPDIDGALKEIEYSFDTLKADGVFIWTSYDTIWCGDPKWNEVWAELNKRKAVIYTHPRSAPCCGNLPISVGEGTIDWQTDTTRAIANTIFSGTALKYPDMKFIWSHGGGTMPFLVRRFIGVGNQPKNKANATPDGFLAAARKMYYDTAQQLLPAQQWPLRNVATVPQILYGTDFPYGPDSDTGKALDDVGIFTPAELKMVNRGNAEKLFPRLKA